MLVIPSLSSLKSLLTLRMRKLLHQDCAPIPVQQVPRKNCCGRRIEYRHPPHAGELGDQHCLSMSVVSFKRDTSYIKTENHKDDADRRRTREERGWSDSKLGSKVELDQEQSGKHQTRVQRRSFGVGTVMQLVMRNDAFLEHLRMEIRKKAMVCRREVRCEQILLRTWLHI